MYKNLAWDNKFLNPLYQTNSTCSIKIRYCCWDRATHWIMLVLSRDHPPASALRCWGYRYASECPSSNYFSNVSLYVCFHSTTAYNSTLPCLITRSLVALSLRFSLSSNSEKTVKNDITQWLCSSWRTSHYTEHSQAVLTSKYYSYLPDQKKKKTNKALRE